MNAKLFKGIFLAFLIEALVVCIIVASCSGCKSIERMKAKQAKSR